MDTKPSDQSIRSCLPPTNGRCIVCRLGWDAKNIDDVVSAVETDLVDDNPDYFHRACREAWQEQKTKWIETVERILAGAGVTYAHEGSYSKLLPDPRGLTFFVEAKLGKGAIIFSWHATSIELTKITWHSVQIWPGDDRPPCTIKQQARKVSFNNEDEAAQFVRLLDLASRMMTNEEIAAELNQLDPTKPLGKELHTAGLRVFATQVAIEAVALRQGAQGLEVQLRKRGPNEPSYVGQYHCPGSFVRSGENTDDVLGRLTKSESLGEVVHAEIVDNAFIEEERGWYCAAVYLVVVKDTPEGTEWFPVDHLPDPTIDHHRNIIIPMAVAHFRNK